MRLVGMVVLLVAVFFLTSAAAGPYVAGAVLSALLFLWVAAMALLSEIQ